MIKFYLKMLLITAGVFSLGLMFGNMTHMGLKLAVVDGAVKGTLFGLVLSAILGTLHVVRARKAAGPNSGPDIYALRQVRQVHSALTRDRAFAMMRHYMEEVAGLTVTLVDDEGGRLEGHSGLTFMTFGNKLTVAVRATANGAAEVTITASPTVFTTLADFGESLRAADGAADYLRSSQHP